MRIAQKGRPTEKKRYISSPSLLPSSKSGMPSLHRSWVVASSPPMKSTSSQRWTSRQCVLVSCRGRSKRMTMWSLVKSIWSRGRVIDYWRGIGLKQLDSSIEIAIIYHLNSNKDLSFCLIMIWKCPLMSSKNWKDSDSEGSKKESGCIENCLVQQTIKKFSINRACPRTQNSERRHRERCSERK